MKTALVTLTIGAEYRDDWLKMCRKPWAAYAERHGYELIQIAHPLDVSDRARSRSPAWQKCLILSQDWTTNYDRVVWIDSDILINPSAPPILENVPETKIGAIDELTYPTPAEHEAVVRSWIEVQRRNPAVPGHWAFGAEPFHTRVGLPGGQKHIVQTGVMVLSPKHHVKVLEHVYNAYEDAGSADLNYEMRPLSHEIQLRNLFHCIDPRFNALLVWLIWLNNFRSGRAPNQLELRNFLIRTYQVNYFLHFAACRPLMQIIAA